MKMSWTRLAVAVLLAVTIGAGAACGTDAETGADADAVVRAVTVTGEGRVWLAPDGVQMTVGVDISRPDLGTAQAAATETMTSVIATLGAHGVASEDIQTATYAIYLDRDDSKTGQPVMGYHVVHTVTATVRDVAAAGTVLAAVVAAGANSIQGIWFAREDSRAAIAEARELAVADARASAEDLARLTDSELGRVVTITESVTDSTSSRDAGDMAEGGSSVPISPGQAVVRVSVTIAWELAE